MAAIPFSNNGVSEIYVITAPDGSRATVHSQGGHVTSWVGAAGDERLFMSPSAVYQRGKALRGGVPIIFPQFSDMGTGPTHGLVRTSAWSSASPQASFSKGVGSFVTVVGKGTPEECRLTLTVTVSDDELRLTAKVDGTSLKKKEGGETEEEDRALFAFAFHSYFAVSDISNVTIAGFDDGMPYADNLHARKIVPADAAKAITKIEGEVDRIYISVPDKKPLTISDPAGGELVVFGENLPDVVLWNPWAEKNARLADLPQPNGYKGFLCIEHGAIGNKAPYPYEGEAWEGSQVVRFVKKAAVA